MRHDGMVLDESTLRDRLGIPVDATEVLVVVESTHWDPDWLLTSEEYLRLMVAPTLDRALDALDAEERRVYGIECAFFPDAYLRARPERRDRFVELANAGRLRFTGTGVTTPDTLLPDDEMLVRDLLTGSQWLHDHGIDAPVRSLYLPDSFGHSPGLPALLAGVGVDYAAVSRVDGMRFPGAELEAADHFPVPGTTAERLAELGSADFVWRTPDGSEVLTHWFSHGYGHGDMLGHAGLVRAMGAPLAWQSREPAAVATQFEGFIDQLRPLARTPYLALAIGLDFSRPIPRLIELIDTWNARDYPRSGVWVVNAGLDDYLDLVATHRDELPMIELDPNPYWTGFYASRPALKRACRDLGREVVTLDALRARRALQTSTAPTSATGTGHDDERCDHARWVAATTNHHDFITGTSPDRTARREQWPWLRRARSEVLSAIRRLESSASIDEPTDLAPGPTPGDSGETEPLQVEFRGDHVVVTTAHFVADFDEAAGATLSSLTAIDGSGGATSLVRPGSLECRAISERGGLWRMGYEFPGGRWRPVDSTRDHPGTIGVRRTTGGVRVETTGTLEGRRVGLTIEFPDDEPVLVVTTSINPRLRRTVTLGWHGTRPVDGLEMHQPGSIVTRPLTKRFDPTYWPLHSWSATTGPETLATVVATAVPTALHATPAGTLDVVVARNAPRELAWGVVPLLGPAFGHERGGHTAQIAFGWSDPSHPNHRLGRALQRRVDDAAGRHRPDWPVTCEDPDIDIITVKPANRGEGVIVRIRDWSAHGSTRTVSVALDPDLGTTITKAYRCDGLEHDLLELPTDGERVDWPISGHIETLRLVIDDSPRPTTDDGGGPTFG